MEKTTLNRVRQGLWLVLVFSTFAGCKAQHQAQRGLDLAKQAAQWQSASSELNLTKPSAVQDLDFTYFIATLDFSDSTVATLDLPDFNFDSLVIEGCYRGRCRTQTLFPRPGLALLLPLEQGFHTLKLRPCLEAGSLASGERACRDWTEPFEYYQEEALDIDDFEIISLYNLVNLDNLALGTELYQALTQVDSAINACPNSDPDRRERLSFLRQLPSVFLADMINQNSQALEDEGGLLLAGEEAEVAARALSDSASAKLNIANLFFLLYARTWIQDKLPEPPENPDFKNRLLTQLGALENQKEKDLRKNLQDAQTKYGKRTSNSPLETVAYEKYKMDQLKLALDQRVEQHLREIEGRIETGQVSAQDFQYLGARAKDAKLSKVWTEHKIKAVIDGATAANKAKTDADRTASIVALLDNGQAPNKKNMAFLEQHIETKAFSAAKAKRRDILKEQELKAASFKEAKIRNAEHALVIEQKRSQRLIKNQLNEQLQEIFQKKRMPIVLAELQGKTTRVEITPTAQNESTRTPSLNSKPKTVAISTPPPSANTTLKKPSHPIAFASIHGLGVGAAVFGILWTTTTSDGANLATSCESTAFDDFHDKLATIKAKNATWLETTSPLATFLQFHANTTSTAP